MEYQAYSGYVKMNKKIVMLLCWFMRDDHTYMLCRTFEFYMISKPHSQMMYSKWW